MAQSADAGLAVCAGQGRTMTAPECLGCALLEIQERCVEWEGGEVRCDQCK